MRKEIIRGLNLEMNKGEVHAIMGPNGAGKSTLSAVIAGREEYEVTSGSIELNGINIMDMAPEAAVLMKVFFYLSNILLRFRGFLSQTS